MTDSEHFLTYTSKYAGDEKKSKVEKIHSKELEPAVEYSRERNFYNFEEDKNNDVNVGLSVDISNTSLKKNKCKKDFIVSLDETVNVFNFENSDNAPISVLSKVLSRILIEDKKVKPKVVLCVKKSRIDRLEPAVKSIVNTCLSDEVGILAGLEWLISECETRLKIIDGLNIESYKVYNKKIGKNQEKMPRIVFWIDRFDSFCFTQAEKNAIDDALMKISKDYSNLGVQVAVTLKKRVNPKQSGDSRFLYEDKKSHFVTRDFNESFSGINENFLKSNKDFNEKIKTLISEKVDKYVQLLNEEFKIYDNFYGKESVYYDVLKYCVDKTIIDKNDIIVDFKIEKEKADDVFDWMLKCKFTEDIEGRYVRVTITKEKYEKYFGKII